IFQEDFGKAGLAVDLRDGLYPNTRCVKREEDQRQTLVALRRRIGAEQAEGPIGEDGAGRPDLMAVQNIFVTLTARGGTHGGKVAAGLRLGPGLRPDFLAR